MYWPTPVIRSYELYKDGSDRAPLQTKLFYTKYVTKWNNRRTPPKKMPKSAKSAQHFQEVPKSAKNCQNVRKSAGKFQKLPKNMQKSA